MSHSFEWRQCLDSVCALEVLFLVNAVTAGGIFQINEGEEFVAIHYDTELVERFARLEDAKSAIENAHMEARP